MKSSFLEIFRDRATLQGPNKAIFAKYILCMSQLFFML